MIEAKQDPSARLEFRYRTGLYLWLFAASLLAAMAYFFVLGPDEGHIVATIALPTLVLAFGSVWLFLALKEDPAYILSGEGFFDNRMGFGRIDWEDIEDVHIGTLAPGSRSGLFLRFGVRDREKYIQRLGNWPRNRQNSFTTSGASHIFLDLKFLSDIGFGGKKIEDACGQFIKKDGSPSG